MSGDDSHAILSLQRLEVRRAREPELLKFGARRRVHDAGYLIPRADVKRQAYLAKHGLPHSPRVASLESSL